MHRIAFAVLTAAVPAVALWSVVGASNRTNAALRAISDVARLSTSHRDDEAAQAGHRYFFERGTRARRPDECLLLLTTGVAEQRGGQIIAASRTLDDYYRSCGWRAGARPFATDADNLHAALTGAPTSDAPRFATDVPTRVPRTAAVDTTRLGTPIPRTAWGLSELVFARFDALGARESTFVNVGYAGLWQVPLAPRSLR
jgi:hypothetical protein